MAEKANEATVSEEATCEEKAQNSEQKAEEEVNNPGDEPAAVRGEPECTQEDAVDRFLSGALKGDFNDDSMPSIAKNRIVDFKSDNVVDFEHDDEPALKRAPRKRKHAIAFALKRRSIKM